MKTNLDILSVKTAAKKRPLRVTEIRWTGLRCKLQISGDLSTQLRLELEVESKVIVNKTINATTVALVVEDDSWLEKPALLRILDNETVICKISTIIGGDS